MLKLLDLHKDAVVTGIEPEQVAVIRFVEPVGPDAITVNYRLPSGETRERMLFRTDEANLALAQAGRPWAFDADGEACKLAVEAWRINLAHLFDPMMTVHTSNVEPLPHQITAVYESMLPRQPLRYVLPGAGKTIMAGLLIRDQRLSQRAYAACRDACGERCSASRKKFPEYPVRHPDQPRTENTEMD